jgi:hypothetical protein
MAGRKHFRVICTFHYKQEYSGELMANSKSGMAQKAVAVMFMLGGAWGLGRGIGYCASTGIVLERIYEVNAAQREIAKRQRHQSPAEKALRMLAAAKCQNPVRTAGTNETLTKAACLLVRFGRGN